MKSAVRYLPLVLSGVLLAVSAPAADLGRQTFSPPEVKKNYNREFMEKSSDVRLGSGIELGASVNFANWKIGDESFSDRPVAPQLSAFFAVNQVFDVRCSLKYVTMRDVTETMDGDMNLWRFGVGSRAWFNGGTDLYPYAGLQFTYNLVNASALSDERGTLGVMAEAGLAFLMTEGTMVSLGIQADTFLANAQGKPKDGAGIKDEDISFNSVGVSLGLTILF